MRLVLLTCFLPLFAFAQSPLGTVTGIAADATGAAVPNAEVAIVNEQTHVERQTVTNAAGAYTFANLLPGRYQVTAEAKGFRKTESPAFALAAFRTVRQDLRLEVAAASTEVTVSAALSEVIQTESPAINARLTTRQILELPTTLRSVYNNSGDSAMIFTMLPLTIPGVVQVSNGAKWLTPGAGSTGIKLKVDGIETNFGNFGSPDPVSQPSMESIEEFTANVLTNRAEFGAMGTVQTVTKSGTNSYHGDLFWYMRNSALDARNFFAVAKPFQNIHNFGASGGGAIKKDKTFFFATLDSTRGSRAYLFTSNVPTLRQRQGDFSDAAALRNPYTGINPFDGNRILSQFLSPQALKAQDQFYPLPNFGPPALTAGNYRAAFNGPEKHHIFELRLDHNWKSTHSTFARYQNKKSDYEIPGARSALPPQSVGTSTNIRRVNFWTLGDVWTPTATLSNEFRAGVVILVSQSDADIKGQQLIDRLGVLGLPGRAGIKGVPNIAVTGLTNVTQSLLNPVNDGHAQLADNLTWIRSRHTFKFGGEYIRWFVNRYLPTDGNLFGNFSFTNRFTGNPYADFLLGLPTNVTRIEPYATQYNRFNDFAFYAQDDWKLTRKLTLSYGLRYEYNGPAYALDDNQYSFDLASGAIVAPSEAAKRLFSPYLPATIPVITAGTLGLDRSLRRPDKNNWAPRLGFSYQVDPKTVVRGGWGVYYSHLSGNIPGGLAAGPFSASTTSNNAFVNGQPLFTFANPFAAPTVAGTLNLSGVAPRLLNSYAQQYSLTVEREIAKDIGVRVSYIGSKGTQLPYRRNVNQPPASATPFAASRRPYPIFNNITYSDNGANMLYSGLQVQVQKRFSQGLLFSSAWTWAKELSDIDDTGDFELNTVIENTYDRRRDRADVYSVPRHQWMNQVLYEIPLAKQKWYGGWQTNVLLNVSTGNFLTPLFSGPDPSNTNTTSARPDLLQTPATANTLDAWYDRNAFAVPANGRFGNAARNIIVGPGFALLNFGVSKNIPMERLGTLQLSASFQNILNHTNFGEPNMTVNNTNGGRITSTHIFPAAGSPRNGLLSLRWRF